MEPRLTGTWKPIAVVGSVLMATIVAIVATAAAPTPRRSGEDIAMLAMAGSEPGSDRYVAARTALDSIRGVGRYAPVSQQSEETAAPPARWDSVSAVAFDRAYDENAVAADLRYKGKLVEITGMVDKVDKGFRGEPFIQLRARGLIGVWAFTSRDADADVARLRPRQWVVLHCLGGGLTGSIPSLEGCIVVGAG